MLYHQGESQLMSQVNTWLKLHVIRYLGKAMFGYLCRHQFLHWWQVSFLVQMRNMPEAYLAVVMMSTQHSLTLWVLVLVPQILQYLVHP